MHLESGSHDSLYSFAVITPLAIVHLETREHLASNLYVNNLCIRKVSAVVFHVILIFVFGGEMCINVFCMADRERKSASSSLSYHCAGCFAAATAVGVGVVVVVGGTCKECSHLT